MHITKLLGAAAIGVASFSGFASAATYNYDYQGLPQTGSEFGEDFNRTFAGFLILDEDLYPGGKIAGSTFRLHHRTFSSGNPLTGPSDYTVTSSAGTFEGFFNSNDLPQFVRIGGIVEEVLYSIIEGEGQFNWIFGDDSEVADWFSGGSYGGSNDFTTSSRGDQVDDGASAGPGTWTLTVTGDTAVPSPVPLPATLPLLALALGGLGIGARRRKASRA